ncbi:hypothetical protein [Mucilaginibacter sp. R-33]|uniref:hypothetical protein n=1 Tax=Mucilaginibacter sp. R-33 TaxID=3416711 RepID=UPI003CF01199
MKTVCKFLLIFFAGSLVFQSAKAQSLSFSFGDLFSQQSKLRRVMAEQIVQYEIYYSALKTGYRITENGLDLAHVLKDGTFSLHGAYFSSLEQVNPLIKNSAKGKAIADLDRQIRGMLAAEFSWQQQQKLLRAAEMAYFKKVRDNLLAKCQLDMDELLQVLTPGKLQLTDAQRLTRLDQLYESMKDKYAFAGSFAAKCRKLALGRKQNQEDKQQLKKLYGIQ